MTPAKRALTAILFAADVALTADDVLERLAGHDHSLVYRGLAQLEELGIAEHVHLGHGQAVYRRRGLGVVPVACTACGRTFDLDEATALDVQRLVAGATGVRVDLAHFPLTGRCADCAKAP